MLPVLACQAPRPRNKLRKLSKRRPGSVVSNVSSRGSADSPRNSSESSSGKQLPSVSQQSSLHIPPPDLSDPKWQEYVGDSGLVRPMETSSKLEHQRSRSPSRLVPELAHLAVQDPLGMPRAGSCVEELPPTPRSTSSTASSTRRRYAKTPVLRIGQLEGYSETGPEKPSDVELIAEQYRALLGDDVQYETKWQDADTRQLSIETIRSAITKRSPRPQVQREWTPPLDTELVSPTSEGTLVDFEEDAAIYFKPAFTPEPLSPIPEDGAYSRPPSPPSPGSSNTLGVQICMDLLARELTSAVRRGGGEPGGEVPPQLVWLMIEAYEKLRDQVQGMQLPAEELKALEDMFDVWLQALYRVHEGIIDVRSRCADEDEMDGLGTEEAD